MRYPAWLISRLWLLAPLLAAGFVVWTSSLRLRHTSYVTHEVGGIELTVDPYSPTGYEDGLRALIAPGHNKDSYQWIAQTQEVLHRGEWRLREVAYDNAPLGREVSSASVYRWWLASIAWVDHVIWNRPLALSVEYAAFYADPLLQVIAFGASVCAVWRWFGTCAALLTALGWGFMFPFAGSFVAGQPDDYGLTLIFGFWSLLPLLAGGLAAHAGDIGGGAARAVRGRFILAGVAGGIGLWINSGVQAPLLLGVFVGGVFAVLWAARGQRGCNTAAVPTLPWRMWAIAGASTSLVSYLLEFAPANLFAAGLEVNHPLYALVWLAGGELLARADAWSRSGEPPRRWKLLFVVACGLVVVGGVALVVRHMALGQGIVDGALSRVSTLPEHAAAENIVSWFGVAGVVPVLATLAPLVVLASAIGVLLSGRVDRGQRDAILIALGPIFVAVGFSITRLRWWSVLDVTLLALVAVLGALLVRAGSWRARTVTAVAVLLIAVPGAITLLPPLNPGTPGSVSDVEVIALVERDLAHWLARKAGPDGAIVLAPPELTAALFYHGGLRGLGSPYPENREGFAISIRIAGASTPDEAEALIRGREVTHIIIPSWDAFLDEYARLAAGNPEQSLVGLLHRWLPPRWLRPVPYPMPGIEGFEDQYAIIFAVTEVQDNATALSRLAEYFVEMGQLEPAHALARTLEEAFPHDLSALIARAHVALASRNATAATEAIQAIVPFLSRGDDQELAWDRRVSLALALLHVNRPELAGVQLRQCAEEADASGIRSLSTSALVRIIKAWNLFGIEVDPPLLELGRKLVPPEMRAGL